MGHLRECRPEGVPPLSAICLCARVAAMSAKEAFSGKVEPASMSVPTGTPISSAPLASTSRVARNEGWLALILIVAAMLYAGGRQGTH